MMGYRRGVVPSTEVRSLRGRVDVGNMWCGGISDLMKYDAAARKMSHGAPLMKWDRDAKERLPVDFSIQAKEGWAVVG